MSVIIERLRGPEYMKGHKKLHLPEKICETCKRPFAWRKKWERDWDNVKYCSDRCRREKIHAGDTK
jgi:hypothetical protein